MLGRIVSLFILALTPIVSLYAAGDVGWPREFDHSEYRVIMYQPQIDTWDDYKLMNFRSAIELAPKQKGKSIYGVVEVDVKTEAELSERIVTLSEFKIKDLRFPNQKEADAAKYADVAKASLPLTPDKIVAVSLDRILANMEAPQTQRKVEINLKPPYIYYSDKPAILVMIIGKPQFQEVPGTKLMAAVNTNWDLFLDKNTSRYYLLNGNSWLTAKDLNKDTWKFAKELPLDLYRLPADPNWDDVRKNVPGKCEGKEPKVFISTEPSELIVTEGDPIIKPIETTKLMDVTNTDSILFYHEIDKNFYFQVSGRWFRAKQLKGPWTSASEDLPVDFALIPDDDENAYIKASVPGTEEAMDAVLLASVPQRTVINKDEAKCTVQYDGAPRFIEVKQTSVKYAINSPNDVFLVDGKFYCCLQGMWFESGKADGPWVLCAKVPAAIYSIPADHPKHNVTYVYVYDSTPTTVYVGYTSGYCGEYVARNGVLMFGMGVALGIAIGNDWDDDCWHWHYSYHCHAHYYGWGCGAVYHHGYGGFYRGAVHYGPYGGAGHIGYYNPATGGWARGTAVYGPRGGAYARESYNPFTDTYVARAGVKTPYGSSGRFYAERGNNEVWGGHESRGGRSVGWAQNDNGAKAAHVDGWRGQGTVAKDKDGNVYVAKDGNVYKRDDDGGWSKNGNNGDWERANDSNRNSTTSASVKREPTQSRSRPETSDVMKERPKSSTSSSSRFKDSSSSTQQLNFDASARDRGNINTERANTRAGGGGGGVKRSSGGRKR